MELKSLKLNAEYASTLGAYWMIYGITGSFASVFMLAKGYDNMHIGMTLAAANLLALGLQPFVADHMDRAKGIKIIDAMVWMILLIMLTGAGYFFFGNGSFLLAAAIAAVLAIHSLIQPLLNSLAFRLSESGADVNYGIGRAGGSLGYSIIVAVLGTLIEKKGEMSVPVCMEAACALLIVMLFITRYSFKKMKRANDIEIAEHNGKTPDETDSDDERIDLKAFIRRNKYFFILNLGLSGLLFSNGILSNYMPQIAAGVGGTTEQTGRILSLMAILEMPTMIFIGQIKRRFQSRTLIKIASIGFTGPGSKTETVPNIPVNLDKIVVTEIYTANYEPKDGKTSVTVTTPNADGVYEVEFQNGWFLIVFHEFSQKVLDGVPTVVHLRQLKYLYDAIDLIANRLVRISHFHFNLVIRCAVYCQQHDELFLIKFLVSHSKCTFILFMLYLFDVGI